MHFFEVSSLASSRALISILHHLEKVKDNKLTLKKGEITSFWASSKASRRDIALEASKLNEIQIIELQTSGHGSSEKVIKAKRPVLISSEASTASVTFEFHKDAIYILQDIAKLIFSEYQIEDLAGMKSRFTLNTLLFCLRAQNTEERYISYVSMRHAMDAENDYEHKQAFFRHVVQIAFADLERIPTKPIHFEAKTETNPETKRPITYGIQVSKLNSPR